MCSLNIDLAQQLLSKLTFTISEIAYQMGFNDPRYFSRCFKRVSGFTPTEYRNKITKEPILNRKQLFDESLFLQKAIAIIENNILVGSISIDKFANELCLSKATLYRRMKLTTELSPSRFILNVRMKHAPQLLKTERNISEVAYQLGFNDPKHFSRCFKTEFGLSANEYRKKILEIKINRAPQLLRNTKSISKVACQIGFNDSRHFSRCFKLEFGISPQKYRDLFA